MAPYKKIRADGVCLWYYDFTHQGRRYRGIGGKTKTQALRVQEKVRDQVIRGAYEFPESKRNSTIDEFSKKFLHRVAHLKSFKRVNEIVGNLLRYFGGRKFLDITTSDVEEYKIWRKAQNVSFATVNRELAYLKRMYNLAIKWNDAEFNPVKEVDFFREPPGRTRFLGIEEIETLLKNANSNLRPVVFTALNTGMRLKEILGLKWSQVHLQKMLEPSIEIRGEQTKNNKSRWIPLNDDMIRFLDSIYKTDSPYVFLNNKGRPYQSVRTAFDTALRKSGIYDFRFHDLRHTFASHFIMNGGDMLSLKEILGHSSLDMVQRYAHLASSHKRKQMNNLSGLAKICHLFATSPQMAEMKDVVNY